MSEATIKRVRGDTIAIRVKILDPDDGSAFDLTSSTLLLSVDTLRNPPDAGTLVFASAGVIVAPATDGRADFPISAGEADQTPGTYYYDIQVTQGSGEKVTPSKGIYHVTQDITK